MRQHAFAEGIAETSGGETALRDSAEQQSSPVVPRLAVADDRACSPPESGCYG